MRLLHDQVRIKPDLPPEKSESGLILTSNALKELPPTGEVMSVAEGITEVKVGEKVVYSVYAALEIDEESVLVPIKSIMAVL